MMPRARAGPSERSSGRVSRQQGATIRNGASGLAASPAGVSALDPGRRLTVSVLGTSLSTVTDSTGRFTLGGVPGGSATLQFSGAGIDARLQVSGLADRQVLSDRRPGDRTQAVMTPAPAATPGRTRRRPRT
jgi:hypothetical protein